MPRPATIRTLTDRLLGGQLAEELQNRRRSGESFDTIARWLLAAHDVQVSAETVRRWCDDLGIEKPEAATA